MRLRRRLAGSNCSISRRAGASWSTTAGSCRRSITTARRTLSRASIRSPRLARGWVDFDDPQTLYPKSITDDSPPDHIWHRSLWYAAGEVIRWGFEGAHRLLPGERGRRARRASVSSRTCSRGRCSAGSGSRWFGGRRTGARSSSDERRFVLYRLKGTGRVFDIEATFTALDEPVTFGQTNENALPLIRVADVIDEWDGGRITLSDGTTGGKDAFAQARGVGGLHGAARAQTGPRAAILGYRDAGPPVEPGPPERVVRALIRATGDKPAVLRRRVDAGAGGVVDAAEPDRGARRRAGGGRGCGEVCGVCAAGGDRDFEPLMDTDFHRWVLICRERRQFKKSVCICVHLWLNGGCWR